MGAEAVGPVDDRAPAEAGARLDRDLPVDARERPRVQVAALVGGQLELVEVGLIGVATHLEHADLLAGARKLTGDDRAAGTGADHADVGLDHLAGGARASDRK